MTISSTRTRTLHARQRSMVHLVSALAVAILGMTGCSSNQPSSGSAPESDSSSTGSTGAWDTSADGRLRFGCALQLGFATGDPDVLHYLDRITRVLYISSVEAEQTRVGSNLWNASDALSDGVEPSERQQLLKICRKASMDAPESDLDALAGYMCQLNTDLMQKRPTLEDFGPESTTHGPGDPLRNDPPLIGLTHLVLGLYADGWEVPTRTPMVGFTNGDDAEYREGLSAVDELCR